MMVSCTSRPEFSARVLGTISRASAYASTPSLARPLTVLTTLSRRCCAAAISKAPAPGTMHLSSTQFLTALSPSRTASLIWSTVCWLGPLMRTVHAFGMRHSSTKVNLSSPNITSDTFPAYPSIEASMSSTEFMGAPPQARERRSMFRRLTRRRARIPSFENMSRESGSMPFMFSMTKLSPSLHTDRLKLTTARHRSSSHFRSDSTSFSRSSAEL
mmetsp:Transcript_23202/g.46307  ORF Transcript_23202/g.46307 Transcript_23202/m.46307 type:complete len:215 (-) Transcript_23202:900-1544(-)